MTSYNTLTLFKNFGSWIVAIVIATGGAIAYVNDMGAKNYLSREDGRVLEARIANLEKDVAKQDEKLERIVEQNIIIIGKLGEIKGKISARR